MKTDHWLKIVLFLAGVIVGGGTVIMALHHEISDLRVEVAELGSALLQTAERVVPSGPPSPD